MAMIILLFYTNMNIERKTRDYTTHPMPLIVGGKSCSAMPPPPSNQTKSFGGGDAIGSRKTIDEYAMASTADKINL